MSLRTILSISPSRWLRLGAVTLGLTAFGCGGEPPRTDEPTTAKDKQTREATEKDAPVTDGKWSGWRYAGNRDECFFVVGKRCFKTEEAACAAATCGAAKCQVVGGGPAAVSCAK